MFCNKCGQEIPDNSRFCHHCGATMAVEPAPAVEPTVAPVVEEAPVVATPVVEQPYVAPVTPAVEDPGASTANTAFILGIVGLAAGTICACACSFLGGILPAIASIIAIVLGNQAKQKSAAAGFENKKAQTAMILGIAGIAVVIVFIILNAILGAIMGATGYYDSLIYDLY